MKKNIVKLIIACAFINPFLISEACTTVIVGKQATEDGKVIIARTSDTIDARRAKNIQLYASQAGTKSYIGLPYWDLEHNRNYDMAQVTTNSYGVSLSATETIQSNSQALALDKPNYAGTGVGEPNIPSIIMPNATSARHAIDILGTAIEKQGVADDDGFGVLVADYNEAWYLETLSGHQWVAVKIPDDVYFVAANGPGQIQEYLPNQYTYKMSNYNNLNPIEFAIKNGIANVDNNIFNFRETYGDINSPLNKNYNYVRVAYIQHLLNPSTHAFNNTTIARGRYATFLTPEKKISVNDIKRIQASHYEEYPDYDPYMRFNIDETKRAYFHPVSNVRTSNGHITVVGKPENKNDFSIANLQYIALGMPSISFYLPIYYGISFKPSQLTGGTNIADNKTLFWQFRKLQALVFINDNQKGIPFEFKKRSEYVQNKYKNLYVEIEQDRKNMENQYRSFQDANLIDKFTQNTLNKISQVNKTMIEYFMQELDINNKYHLTTDTQRNQWFTNIVYQQDCNYRRSHCKNLSPKSQTGKQYSKFASINRFVDKPVQ